MLPHKKKLFSIVIGESTNTSNSKSLVVGVCHVDEVKEDQSGEWKKVVKDPFLKLIEVQQCKVGDLHTMLTNLLFKEIAVPKRDLIGFASNNSLVIVGGKGGLQAKLSFVLGQMKAFIWPRTICPRMYMPFNPFVC